jgi:thiosulfate/3-mercaptopyruvate sulfurtransferase
MSRTDVLVDADWAESHLNDPTVVFVEVDEDVSAYDTGHLAGAVRLDWATELQQADVRDVIERAAFEKLLSAKGISNDDTVVLYGGNNNWFAAYAYWYLKLYGHRDVRLLDGGRKKWEIDGRPLTTDVVERPRTEYRANEQDLSLRAFAPEVRDAIGTKNLVDVRSPDEFAGKLAAPAHLPQEAGARLGHIPTAVNLPWSKTAQDDGTFKSDEELRELYADAGLDPDKEVIAYCRIGERSSHSWFVLRELLGYTSAKNYDGSYLQWASLEDMPVHNPQTAA